MQAASADEPHPLESEPMPVRAACRRVAGRRWDSARPAGELVPCSDREEPRIGNGSRLGLGSVAGFDLRSLAIAAAGALLLRFG
jgi:hypothetical protein